MGCGVLLAGLLLLQPIAAAAEDVDILFVGDSFTHGRYDPVRGYKSGFGDSNAHVHDLNCLSAATCAAAELPGGNAGGTRELGPFGGVPGIVLELLEENGVRAAVSIQARSASTLTSDTTPGRLADIALDRFTRRPWTAVVLQDQSYRPLPAMTFSNGRSTDPAAFAASVGTIAGVIGAADRQAGLDPAPPTRLWLFETWPLAAFTYEDARLRPPDFPHPYLGQSIEAMARALHASYEHVATSTPGVAGVAPVGSAWVAAIEAGIARRDPYPASGPAGQVDLWDGDVAAACCTVPIGYHAGAAGSYLAAVTLFDRITGRDARPLGRAELAAAALGLSPDLAVRLQIAAAQAVIAERSCQRARP